MLAFLLAGLGVNFTVHPYAYVVHYPHHDAATFHATVESGQRDKVRAPAKRMLE